MMLVLIGIGFALIGIVIGLMLDRVRYDGVLIIDDSDEMKTNWELKVNTEVEKIPKKRSIHLKVYVKK